MRPRYLWGPVALQRHSLATSTSAPAMAPAKKALVFPAFGDVPRRGQQPPVAGDGEWRVLEAHQRQSRVDGPRLARNRR